MSPIAHALFVEDEPSLASALEIAFRKMGIAARHASTIEQARSQLQARTPDLLLLDRTLPDGDGLTLCEEVRKKGYDGAILMLTAIGQVDERILGLKAGADDYLPKPFSWDELEARILAVARRLGKRAQAAREWEFDEKRLCIRSPHRPDAVELTPLEFKLASRLISACGQIVTRNELLKDVWGFNLLPKTRTVDHFLGRLRKFFEENPEEPQHFLTVRGAGYRFEP